MAGQETITEKGTGFLRLPDVLRLVPVSRSTWWNGIQEGRYPRGVKLGPRATGWRVEDIRALIERLATASHAESRSTR